MSMAEELCPDDIANTAFTMPSLTEEDDAILEADIFSTEDFVAAGSVIANRKVGIIMTNAFANRLSLNQSSATEDRYNIDFVRLHQFFSRWLERNNATLETFDFIATIVDPAASDDDVSVDVSKSEKLINFLHFLKFKGFNAITKLVPSPFNKDGTRKFTFSANYSVSIALRVADLVMDGVKVLIILDGGGETHSVVKWAADHDTATVLFSIQTKEKFDDGSSIGTPRSLKNAAKAVVTMNTPDILDYLERQD